MSNNKWPKRDPIKNYFPLPNEIFSLGLDSSEISIYAYLLRCENRKTFQCWPSYKTIGRAVGLCENTVRKYVSSLEEKGLIRTEPTTLWSRDGRGRNGTLRYTICPMHEVLERSYQRQLMQAQEDAARQIAAERLAKHTAQDR